jgi:hypothetical protein
MIKKTFEEVRKFNIAADGFLRKSPTNIQTKLGYAIDKISGGQLKKIISDYQKDYAEKYFEQVQKKQIDLALTDKTTGAVLANPKNAGRPYEYDKAGLMEIIKIERDFASNWEAELEAWDKKEFDIEPHFAVEIPEDLTDNEKEAFKGFVIPLAK